MTNSPASNNIEALSGLTKKLQEISSTYDDVRRDMSSLQEVSILLYHCNDIFLTFIRSNISRDIARQFDVREIKRVGCKS